MTVNATEVKTNVVAIDIPKQVIVVGNIENLNNGVKITNKSTYKYVPKIIPPALESLGKGAYVVVDMRTIINLRPVEEKNSCYTSYHRSCKVAGMILDSIDGTKREILFKQDSKGKIYCKAFLDSRANSNALSMLGKPCTFYLSTKTPRAKDSFKSVVDVTE